MSSRSAWNEASSRCPCLVTPSSRSRLRTSTSAPAASSEIGLRPSRIRVPLCLPSSWATVGDSILSPDSDRVSVLRKLDSAKRAFSKSTSCSGFQLDSLQHQSAAGFPHDPARPLGRPEAPGRRPLPVERHLPLPDGSADEVRPLWHEAGVVWSDGGRLPERLRPRGRRVPFRNARDSGWRGQRARRFFPSSFPLTGVCLGKSLSQ